MSALFASKWATGLAGPWVGRQTGVIQPKTPEPPAPPNPNDAANAARAQSDEMRLRRGMLANIYAGSTNQTPAVGKTQLGT
ncbi:MAG TPA: hypothetical protein VMU47_06670 [Caldimonas sp.]|nr:hypothetical protein [Caldimonas sp.]